MSELLKDTIQKEYNRQDFVKFTNEMLNGIDTSKQHQLSIQSQFDDYVEDFTYLSQLDLEDASSDLAILEVKMKRASSLERAHSTQRNLVAKHLKQNNLSGAIVAFYAENTKEWRLSFVKMDLSFDEEGKVVKEFTPARRFSFLLGEDIPLRTPLEQLTPLLKKEEITLKDLRESFSVQKVTEKFFEKFRSYYENLKAEFEENNKAEAAQLKDKYTAKEYQEKLKKYAFSFIGRLFFIYFIQRKGWLENNKKFIKESIKDGEYNSIYQNLLRPLYFDVFNTEKENRPSEIKEKYSNTPFLNGGLFEKNEFEANCSKIHIPDEFLKDMILEFFEAYNFTAREDTSLDKEVSINPDMLGKIFENIIAEEERDKKGTFYTPREVVHYMVRESLWQFLVNETEIKEAKLRNFIFNDTYQIEKFTKEEIRIIDKKLENVKILDPAVGSAAFPVEVMRTLVEKRKKLNVEIGKNINEIELKKRFIRNNLYGVDIDSGAIEVAKLRLWLSLIVDYKKSEVEPLPNLDFQFRIGNSLQEKVAGFKIIPDSTLSSKTSDKEQGRFSLKEKTPERIKEMQNIIGNYFEETDREAKKEMKEKFNKLEEEIFETRIEDLEDRLDVQIKNSNPDSSRDQKQIEKTSEELEKLKRMEKLNIHKLFIPKLHFFEVFKEKDGFDIVIGNPPYGVKVDNEIKKEHNLDSKDSYGVFTSTAFKRFLKEGGVLSYITSDTWLTIKTHKALREQILSNSLHRVIRLHRDCFDATVNACVFTVTKDFQGNQEGEIIAADFTNISTRNEKPELRDKLYHLEKFIGQSTPKFAVYSYKQELISTNSNKPIFVASPKLFRLMNDTTYEKVTKKINGESTEIRKIELNGEEIKLVRLGGIADVVVGLQTGDNDYYLYQELEARGTYKNINDYREFVVKEEELDKICNDENLRKKVIENGFHKSKDEENFDPDLYFGERYIVPYDKGGKSNIEEGWLPNYYVPTDYYIDWSQEAVERMKTLTTKERNEYHDKEGGSDKVCSRFQNRDYYFRKGITFSMRGVYAPTFRINSSGVFDVMSSMIFPKETKTRDSLYRYLGILTSRLERYLLKNFIEHTVAMDVDAIKEAPFLMKDSNKIKGLVKDVVNKQRSNLEYNYIENEQKEINKLVYEMYGLNEEDVKEVETWYARRYPKLADNINIKNSQ